MKLFIERLKIIDETLSPIYPLITTLLALYLIVSYPILGLVIGWLVAATLLFLVISAVYAAFHWLFIEPFFTKKGADRK